MWSRTPQADTNRLRPRTSAGRRRAPPGNGGVQLADCNLTARGDESFADDLAVQHGRVMGRVALSLRSHERQPSLPDLFLLPIDGVALRAAIEGVVVQEPSLHQLRRLVMMSSPVTWPGCLVRLDTSGSHPPHVALGHHNANALANAHSG